MKTWMITASAVASLLACGQAAAQFKNAGDAIDSRQGALTVMGNHFGRIGLMVNDKVPFDARAVQVNADLVATLAKLPWAGFIDGSDTGDTNAKPEIWTQQDRFRANAVKLQEATVKLAEVARGGNRDAIKAAFGATAETCKSCHDDFRKKH
jgi:cytochrome c556